MTRKIDFFDGAESGTTPTIGNVTADNLVTYPDDSSYEAAVDGAPAKGNIYYNTTSDLIRYYNGTAWINIVDESTSQTLTNKSIDADTNTITNIDNNDIKAGAGIDATKLADGSVDNTELQYINSLTSNAQDQIDTAQGTADANTTDIADIRTTTGTADGATDMGSYTGSILTASQSTKQNIQELSDAIEGLTSGLAFQGNWNANTNTPTLTSSTGTAGHYYYVSVAGTTNLDGISDWGVGDWAVFTDTGVWQKVDNSDVVISVNGQQGAVVLDTDDISEGGSNLYYTDTRADARIAAASIDDLSDVDTSTVAPVVDQALIWDGANFIPGDVATSGGSGLKNFFSEANSKFEVDTLADTDWDTFDHGGLTAPIAGDQSTPATNVSAALSSGVETIAEVTTDDSHSSMSTTNAWKYQGIKPSSNTNLGSARFLFNVTNTSLDGNLVYKLYSGTGGPTNQPNSLIATSDSINISTLTTGTQYIELTFPTNPALTAGTEYCIVIDPSGITDFTGTIRPRVQTSAPYTDSTAGTSNDGGSSWIVGSFDFRFTAYTAGGVILEGTKSLTVSKAGVDASGEGVSCIMENIEVGYQYDNEQERMIAESSFVYDTSAVNYAGTWGVYIYDIVNDVNIPILESDNLIPQGKGKFNYSYLVPQDDPDPSQLKLVLVETDTNTDTYDLIFDIFKSGPDKILSSAPVVTTQYSEIRGGSSVGLNTDVTQALDSNTDTGLFSYSSGIYTFLRDCTVTATASFQGNDALPIIIRNGSETLTGDRVATSFGNTSWSGEIAAGDTLKFRNGTGSAVSGLVNVYMSAVCYDSVKGSVQNSQLETLSTTSNIKTPSADNNFHALTNNSLILKAGKTYDLEGSALYSNAGSVNYTSTSTGIYAANGTDSSTEPAYLSSLSSLQIISANDSPVSQFGSEINAVSRIRTDKIRVRALQDTTIYIVTYATLGTSANARITAFLNAYEVPFGQTAIVQQNKVAKIYDEKSTGANGGTNVSGLQDRTLNTLDDPFGLIKSLSSNLFTFSSKGKYYFQVEVPAMGTNQHKALLTKSDNTVELVGSAEYSLTGANYAQSSSKIQGYLTVTDTNQQYKIRHYTSAITANLGLGASTNDGSNPEVYTQVQIWKIGE